VYYDWKRGGGRASNTQNAGAKNYSLDLYGELWGGEERLYSKNKDINSSLNLHGDIKNKLKCITIGRGEEEGFKHPKSYGKNSSFKLRGVNSRFLYTETILKVP